TLNGSVLGGHSPIHSFLWSPSSTLTSALSQNPRAYPQNTTAYLLTVRSGNCQSLIPDTVIVNVIPTPQAFLSGNTQICFGDTTFLKASGAQTFNWLPMNLVGATVNVQPTSTTTYSVIPQNQFCFGDTATIVVTVKPLPQTTFSLANLICQVDTTIVTYTGNAPSTATFNWDFGTAHVVSGSGAGPFSLHWLNTGIQYVSLEIIQDGCRANRTDSIFIQVTPIADAGEDYHICKGRSGVVLTASVQGAAATLCNYRWFPAAGLDNPYALNPLANPDTTTTYYFQAICNGCISNLDSMVVHVTPLPVATISQPIVQFCAGQGGVELPGGGFGGVGPLSYSWTPQLGLSSWFIANPNANPTADTVYHLVVTDSMGCASDTASVLVRVNPIPIANAGPDVYLCGGIGAGAFLNGSASGGGFGSYSYYWTPSAGLSDSTFQNPYARPDTTTIYQLIVVNNQTGCSSQPTALDTLSTVTVFVAPMPIANGGPDVTICYGDSIVIGDLPSGAGPNYTYRWTPSTGLSDSTAQRPIAKPDYTTIYYLTVTSNGCTSVADTVTVYVAERPTVEAGPNVAICPGDSVQLSGRAHPSSPGTLTYLWQPTTGLSNPQSPNPMASPSQSQYYYLYASLNGCVAGLDSVYVNVLPTAIVDADTVNMPLGYEICYGDSIVLPAKVISTSSPPTTIRWSDGLTLSDSTIVNPVARPLETTMYYLYATVGGCTTVDSVLVRVLPGIFPVVSADTNIICQGGTATLTASAGIGSATYSWSPASGLNRTDSSTVIAS
ncbi:MAG: hypothetical protein NZ108_06025, partial [Bacteroidia bacterium]|nr:hypothetical protein [Bacteroidia bacterium]